MAAAKIHGYVVATDYHDRGAYFQNKEDAEEWIRKQELDSYGLDELNVYGVKANGELQCLKFKAISEVKIQSWL